MKYPCSYLVYSRAFQELPELAKRRVFERFDEVLTGRDTDARYAHLSADDRTAIREILLETCPEFAAAVDSLSRVDDTTRR